MKTCLEADYQQLAVERSAVYFFLNITLYADYYIRSQSIKHPKRRVLDDLSNFLGLRMSVPLNFHKTDSCV